MRRARGRKNLRPSVTPKETCDSTMVNISPERINEFMTTVPHLGKENLQVFQKFILCPFISHIYASENKKKIDVLIPVIDTVTLVLQQIHVETMEVAMKTELALLSLVFDKASEGMVAKVPEELKLSVMKSLTALMLRVVPEVKLQILKTQAPMLAQAIFVSVHIAKLDRMKLLRLTALDCLGAHTMSHPACTDDKMQVKDKELDELTADFLATILPGTLAALQDVAMSTNNPGHAVISSALESIHRILCITMHNRRLKKKGDISVQDFMMMIAKSNVAGADQKPQSFKDIPSRSPEWYKMAGEKLLAVTRNLAPLVSHEHYLVRRELAVLFGRIIEECCDTLPTSVPLAWDIMLALSKDGYKEVSQLCITKVDTFFNNASYERRMVAVNGMCEHFFRILTTLPRIFNNIDSERKLAALNQMYGYLEILSNKWSRPQRLTVAISAVDRCDTLCDTLLSAATLQHELTLLTKQSVRDVISAPVTYYPWRQLRHLDNSECQKALESIIQLLAAAECSELLLDRLLQLFYHRRDCELVYVMNWLGSAPNAPTRLAKRIIDTYVEDDIWNLPLDIGTDEKPLTKDETLDPEVYNPRAWTKDSTPGLYEGATEVRYTDISYLYARDRSQDGLETCRNVAQLQRNVAMSCLLTEGVGWMAKHLKGEFQPFLLKTLCLVLERVGSKYEVLHNCGTKALNDIAEACSLGSAAELIAQNADYFTSQISIRLKKAWDMQSALRILTVVMSYSDTSILEYLYAIVEDVLVQSCDKYHQNDLFAYLQVFECFVSCINKWFPAQKTDTSQEDTCVDYLKEFTDFIENSERVERLLNEEVDEDFGKSAEEMYKEDLAKREEEDLICEDSVTQETPPLPKHVSVTLTILKRTINFIPLKERDECILSMHIMTLGLPILREYENELLPLIHSTWEPLVTRFNTQDPLVARKALELLVVMGGLSKDFIRSRALKDVLPQIFKFLSTASASSFLKDSGASYRLSAAYSLQRAALAQLPRLLRDLALDDGGLEKALACVVPYLSRKQPKQLQGLAVNFYKLMLKHNYGLTWYHLRTVCGNSEVLKPPTCCVDLQPVVGTPYRPVNKDYNASIRLIFELPSDA